MISNYKIDNDILIINLDYNYEFGKFNIKNKPILKNVTDLINKINFKGKKVIFTIGGIAFASILLNTSNITHDYKYIDSLVINNAPIEYVQNDSKTFENEIVYNVNTPQNEKKQIDEINKVNNDIKFENKQQIKDEKFEKKLDEQQIKEITDNKINIDEKEEVVFLKRNSSIEKIEINDYITGVVAAEMPASFSIEALKVQAIIARTYYYKNKDRKEVTDNSLFQNYIDINQMKNKWGNDFEKYYNKIKDAVNETNNLIITYKGSLIDAVYFATSNGYTEDAINVWGNDIPYLKNIDSSWDKTTTPYLKTINLTYEDINKKLSIDLTNESTISIEKNTYGYVSNIVIDDISYTGKEFREKLGLRSTDFDIVLSDTVSITTRGYGHAVGLSQYGSNEMAKKGYNYQDIIKYYYKNVEIKKQA